MLAEAPLEEDSRPPLPDSVLFLDAVVMKDVAALEKDARGLVQGCDVANWAVIVAGDVLEDRFACLSAVLMQTRKTLFFPFKPIAGMPAFQDLLACVLLFLDAFLVIADV